MAETFYSALGVAPDADRQTIRRAYREHVKETHPDVSDDPDSTRAFKRLTAARDVLLDVDERKRYDRLGHAAYVRRHVETPVWSGEEVNAVEGTNTVEEVVADTNRAQRVREQGESAGRSTRRGGPRGRRRHRATTTSTATGGDGHAAHESWQTAARMYRSGDVTVPSGRNSLRERVAAVRKVAPWLVVHAVLVTSTLATVSVVYPETTHLSSSLLSLAGSVFLVSSVAFLSVLHLVSLLYS